MISYLRDHYKNSINDLTNSESQLITEIAYNKHFNLINRTTNTNLDNVLSTITYKESEDPYYATEIYSLMSDFFSLDIYKFTGLSYKDFMMLSKEEVEIIREFILEIKSSENQKMKVLEENLNKADHNSSGGNSDFLYDYRRM